MKSKRRQHLEENATVKEEAKTLLPQNAAGAWSDVTQADNDQSPTTQTKQKKKKNKMLTILKIVLPHLCLSLFILCYAMMGAAIFQRIEYDHDLAVLEEKAGKIVNLYARVANEVQTICSESGNSLVPEWDHKMYQHLSQLSAAHELRSFEVKRPDEANPKDLVQPRWSYIDSILYSVSILTTTGYVNATPTTDIGQIVTVIYGLFGIPVMVLTAVDYGRFLSDIVLFLYSKLAKFPNKILRASGCLAAAARKKVSTNVRVETKLLEDGRIEKVDDKRRKTKLPLWANFSVLLLFNTLGAFVYMLHGETKPDFLESFFVCFNLVANLTMGEVPVVRDLLMVIYIVFFVTFGLAVLSMCAELAASELKWLFLKIHYFGRKIQKKAKTSDEELDFDIASLLESLYRDHSVPVYVEEVELKELLKIIDEIRKRYPQKHKITRQDILDYIQSQINSPTNKDYAFGVWRMRRDTIAFMPEVIEVLKFADDDHGDEQSLHQRPPSLSNDSTSSSSEGDLKKGGSHANCMIEY